MLDFRPSQAAVPGRAGTAPSGRSTPFAASTPASAGSPAESRTFADAMAAIAAAIEGRTGAHATDAQASVADTTGSSTSPVSPNVPANSSLPDAVQPDFPSGWAVPSKGDAGATHAQAGKDDASSTHANDSKTDAAADAAALAAIVAAALAPAVPPVPHATPTGDAATSLTGDHADAHGDTDKASLIAAIDTAAKTTAGATATGTANATATGTGTATATGTRQAAGTPAQPADDRSSATGKSASGSVPTDAPTPAAAAAQVSAAAADSPAPQVPTTPSARFADFVARALSSQPNATIADVIAAARHADARPDGAAGTGTEASPAPGAGAASAFQRAFADDLRLRAVNTSNPAAASGDRATDATRAAAAAAGLDGASHQAQTSSDKTATSASDVNRALAGAVADVVQKVAAPAHDAGVSFGFESAFAGGQKDATLAAPAATTSFATSLASAQTTLPSDTVGQIVQAIRLQWANGGVGEARITLQPDQFGDVTVSVRVDRGQVVARVEADAPVVREWLQSNQSTLRHGLAEQNLALDRLEVSEPRESRDADRRGQRDTPDQPHQQPRRPRRMPLDDTFEVVA